LLLISGKQPHELHDPATDGVLWGPSGVEVSDGLRAIADRALEHRPKDRFGSAAEMLASLEALIAPSSTAIEPQQTVVANARSVPESNDDYWLPDVMEQKGTRYNLHRLVITPARPSPSYQMRISRGSEERNALEIEFHYSKSEVANTELERRLKLECKRGHFSWLRRVEDDWEIDADALRTAVPAFASFEWLTGRGRIVASIAFNTSGPYPPHEGKNVISFLLKEELATGVWSATM
jgi:hypothetical protein